MLNYLSVGQFKEVDIEISVKKVEPEILVEAQCKVCGDWLEAGWYHGSCYKKGQDLIENGVEYAEVIE